MKSRVLTAMKYFLLLKLKSQLQSKRLNRTEGWNWTGADWSGLDDTPLPVKKASKSNYRFKTERCRQFYELGRCDYGSKCMFAHGLHELKEELANRPRNYKTRLCTTYQLDGYCTFGSRCSFVHSHNDPFELLESTIAGIPRIPMPENSQKKSRPEFYPSDILTRKPNREMISEEMLLPSPFHSDNSVRLSTFVRLTDPMK